MMSDPARPFWETKALTEMTSAEWESLCDGCGKCCLIKLEDADSGAVHYTNIGCKLLDPETCRCAHYQNRKEHVPDCVMLTPQGLETLSWMPQTCAYRLLYEGKPLPPWHPLITGEPDSTHKAGQSVRRAIYREGAVAQSAYPNHIWNWDEKNHGQE